jgi:V/A-type H+-transporting ATPase subunit I
MRELGIAFLIAGLVAMVFGGVVFQDALGMPLTHNEHMLEELNAQGISAAAATCGNVYDHLHEAPWTCLVSGRGAHLESLAHLEPLVHKVTDVHTMLVISLVAAGVHLLLGLLIGIRNEWGHGAKHLGAKIGFLILLLAFYPAVLALLSALPSFLTASQAYMIAGGGFVLGAIILGWAEGAAGVLEIPSMLSNILSYLRLGAVAIAKGAMAAAFNNLTLIAIGLSAGAGIALLLLALVAFVLVQALLFVLGVLSAGIQAIRLNFVEFFTKFFKGGGQPFRPFGRERQVTTTTTASPSNP